MKYLLNLIVDPTDALSQSDLRNVKGCFPIIHIINVCLDQEMSWISKQYFIVKLYNSLSLTDS